MAFLKRNYYVSSLSAACIYGAAHQMPQTFFVVADGAPLRDGIKNGTKIVFTQRQ